MIDSVARYRVMTWNGIPAQVKVFGDTGRPVSAVLSDRWQQEIDRVAMQDGLEGSDDYLAGWGWSEDRERPGAPAEVLDAVVAELEAGWDDRPSASSPD